MAHLRIHSIVGICVHYYECHGHNTRWWKLNNGEKSFNKQWLILVSAKDSYNYLMEDLRDPRVDSWPLMASIWPTTLICIIYVYVVKVRYKKDLCKWGIALVQTQNYDESHYRLLAPNSWRTGSRMRYGGWWLFTTPSRQCSASGCSRRAGPFTWVGITAGTANPWTILTMTRFYSHQWNTYNIY